MEKDAQAFLKVFLEKSKIWNTDITSEEFAKKMDDEDPLGKFRERFYFPKKKYIPNVHSKFVSCEEDALYLSGHSLGLQPKVVENYLQKVLNNWSQTALFSHFIGYTPAAYCDLIPKSKMAKLVGANESEIVIMNSLTVNLHILMASFYKPTSERYKIIVEEYAFPSDNYAVQSQVTFHGYTIDDAIIKLKPRTGQYTLILEDIISVIEKEGDSVALILLPGVQYYTGQVFDMESITRYAHKKNCVVGFDLAHAVGNIKMSLHDWNVDFAAWCTYKYMNAGAGSMGAVFVHEKHTNPDLRPDLPRLKGWWGVNNDTKFLMKEEFEPCSGADKFKLSNPSPFLMAMLMASLDLFDEIGLHRLLEKQVLITGYAEYLLKQAFHESHNKFPQLQVITPSNPKQRGNQLSLLFSIPINNVEEELQHRGIVCDSRHPSVIRISFCPSYNSFLDAYKFVDTLKEIFQEKK